MHDGSAGQDLEDDPDFSLSPTSSRARASHRETEHSDEEDYSTGIGGLGNA